jgi:hypothetical protein
MRKSPFLVAAVIALGITTAAQATGLGQPCTTAPQQLWILDIPTVTAKAVALGYTVRKARLRNACVELYANDSNGVPFEVFVDPTNGNVLNVLDITGTGL